MMLQRGWHALAVAAAIAVSVAAPASAAAARAPRDLAGVWWSASYQPRLVPQGGGALPLTAEGRARYASNMAGLKSGALVDRAVQLCLPEGLPRALTSAYPFQIMMIAGEITFVHEANRAFRIVSFSDQHANPDDWDPSFMGDGIAAWEGDTLRIDTTNFKTDKVFLDASGLPASAQLHIVEHLRLLDGGRRLEDLVTVTDPLTFSAPWTARRVFERHDEVELRTDWVCGEAHRAIFPVLKGAKK